MRHPAAAKLAAQFMFASPSRAKHVRTSSCAKARASVSYTRGLASSFIIAPFASDSLRCSASSGAFPVAVELHRAAAEGEVGGRLELLHERCRARARPELAAFGDGLVRMREDHRDGPHQLVHGMRAGDEDPRVV